MLKKVTVVTQFTKEFRMNYIWPTMYNYIWTIYDQLYITDFPGGSYGKASVYNEGDPDSIPGLGRSPGEGNGNPFQYYCLENPMDKGA